MRKIVVFWICVAIVQGLGAQTLPDCFRIYLHDKNNNSYSIAHPEAFLSPRALAKRVRFAIPVTEQDLPVSPAYISQILEQNMHIQLLSKSKWTNTVTVYCSEAPVRAAIAALPFVDSLVPVGRFSSMPFLKRSAEPLSFPNPLLQNTLQYNALIDSAYYGSAFTQIAMHNGHLLHKAGFRGEGMLIAVIDAGWESYYPVSFMQSLVETGQLEGIYDLLPGNLPDLYNMNGHGVSVTSIMAEQQPNVMVGTAPNAHYLFIRSENVNSEEPIEEDFWATAAELADSLGADVINSSLGYTTFPDFPEQSVTYSNNNGIWSIASCAATIAAQKGIIVCVAAGNDGANSFRYVGRPGDAAGILTVGAVGADSATAIFSSIGPTYDGRVKPDVVAMGYQAIIVNPYVIPEYEQGYFINPSSGTSFATPIIAGLSACLWQALPDLSASQIMDIIRKNSHQYNAPDSAQGYGIPDFYHALPTVKTMPMSIVVYPNPCNSIFHIVDAQENFIQLNLYDMNGKLQLMQSLTQNHLHQIDVTHLKQGFYLGKIITKTHGSKSFKLIVTM
jgi:subtilisin family serine protease